MKTYLVPIDFSEAAINAAELAALLSKQSAVKRIILMNAFYISPYQELLPNPDMFMIREQEIEEEVVERVQGLEKLKIDLLAKVKEGVEIEVVLQRSHLIRAVVNTIANHEVDVVILGSIGNTSANAKSLGKHVTGISKASTAPVLIVPPAFIPQPISTAVLASDFLKVKDTFPADALDRVLGDKNIDLLVVNIDPKGKHAVDEPEHTIELAALKDILKGYNASYFNITDRDVIAGVLNFATANNAQMVVALPHKYSFLQSVLHSSVSRQLAASSVVPVLLLK